MFITAFYGVIDKKAGVLRYANTGHPHAFVVTSAGDVERLHALDPPLGMVDEAPRAASRAWIPGEDLLLLFTDGVSDARNRADARLGEQVVLDLVTTYRDEAPAAIMQRILDALDSHVGDIPRRDDLTLVIARS